MRPLPAVLAALLLAGCATPAPPGANGTNGGTGSTALLDVARIEGCASQQAAERSDVINSQGALQELWGRSCGGGQAPSVDFARRTVVAYFWGEKRTGGYSTEVVNASDDGARIVVRVARDTPGPACYNAQIITHPADLASIPSTSKPVVFDTVDRTMPC
ncbi:MAG: protease complex subunit PrcB family protein [Halobacteriales archaeon]|nr:protease complex subunit PrcB family protein [Halobacteriales archaeon]